MSVKPKIDPEVEARMAAAPEPDLDDPDNPEWTEDDFARAVGPEFLSPEELAAFPRTLERLRRMGKAPPELAVEAPSGPETER